MEDGLDNPFWSCLATRHAHLAEGDALARRYRRDISPLAGIPQSSPANIAALASRVDLGEEIVLAGSAVPELRGNWKTRYATNLTQMVRIERAALDEGDVDATPLGAADVPEMAALVELTHPGPFRARTIELGHYIGIRKHGRLVAMAGERTWIGDYREVSAVCTHPDAQGRGYARALIGRVVNRMLRAGQIPYLHVESKNEVAIDVYRRLGFLRRTQFPALFTKRIG
jgi:ribosomal protein S18 acetylase RimI-like enzyme